MRYGVLVEIRLKAGIADPQGATVERALPALGFTEVGDVRVGKAVRLTVEAPGPDEARAEVDRLCRRLLANPVIEEADISVEPAGDGRR